MLNIFINLLLVVHVLVCLLIVVAVLMQRPKNEGLGAAFGSAMTDSLFGTQTTNVLATVTRWLGGLFFVLTLVLSALYARQGREKTGVEQRLQQAPKPADVPKVPAEPSAPEAAKPAPEAPKAPVEPAAPAPEAVKPAPEAPKAPVEPSAPAPEAVKPAPEAPKAPVEPSAPAPEAVKPSPEVPKAPGEEPKPQLLGGLDLLRAEPSLNLAVTPQLNAAPVSAKSEVLAH